MRFSIPYPGTEVMCGALLDSFDGQYAIVWLAVPHKLKDGRVSHGQERWAMRREIVEACLRKEIKCSS